jgi:hypothetical protein
MERAEISETYILNQNVQAVAIDNTNIYTRTDQNTVYTANLNSNLIDKSNWKTTNTYPPFNSNTADWNTYIDIVNSLKPGGPQFNDFYESKFYNGKLYTTGGAFLSGFRQKDNPGIVQIYNGSEWTIYPNELKDITGFNYQDINCIDIDPTDNNRVMVGGRCGLYEFYNGQLNTFYYKNTCKNIIDIC